VIRNRLAALLLALGGATFLGLALAHLDRLSLDAVGVLLGLGGLHAALAGGVLRDRASARWLGVGLSFFWLLGAAVAVTVHPPLRWGFIALHLPLPVLLLRPDELHPRTSLSLLLTGAGLVPAVFLGWAAAGAPEAWSLWSLPVASLCAVLGAVGLARGRTWGLLLVLGAGAALTASALACEALDGRGAELVGSVGLLLGAAGAPFARPIVRFLRGGA